MLWSDTTVLPLDYRSTPYKSCEQMLMDHGWRNREVIERKFMSVWLWITDSRFETTIENCSFLEGTYGVCVTLTYLLLKHTVGPKSWRPKRSTCVATTIAGASLDSWIAMANLVLACHDRVHPSCLVWWWVHDELQFGLLLATSNCVVFRCFRLFVGLSFSLQRSCPLVDWSFEKRQSSSAILS